MIFRTGGSEAGAIQKQSGTLLAMTIGTLKDTPALDALKASCGAPISMGRGETPVGCCQRPSGFAIFLIFIFASITAPCYDAAGNMMLWL